MSVETAIERRHLLNGKLVDEAQLVLSARDIGLLRGYGVFDFLITYHHGRPFHLGAHIDRLYRSATVLEIDLPWPKRTVIDWTHEALAANAQLPGEHQIRLVATGGVGLDSMTPASDSPTLLIFVDPHRPYPRHLYEQGAGVITAPYRRHWPAAKSLSYIEGVIRVAEARRHSAIEVIYHDEQHVFEGATSNLFAVLDGQLCTPKSDLLIGITRTVILEQLDLPLTIEVVDFPLASLRAADEAFLTASNKEVMPIVRIDAKPVGDGQVGPQTRRVMAAFRQYTDSTAW